MYTKEGYYLAAGKQKWLCKDIVSLRHWRELVFCLRKPSHSAQSKLLTVLYHRPVNKELTRRGSREESREIVLSGLKVVLLRWNRV